MALWRVKIRNQRSKHVGIDTFREQIGQNYIYPLFDPLFEFITILHKFHTSFPLKNLLKNHMGCFLQKCDRPTDRRTLLERALEN